MGKTRKEKDEGTNFVRERTRQAHESMGVDRRPKIPRRPSKTKDTPVVALSAANRRIERDRLLDELTVEVDCLPDQYLMSCFEVDKPPRRQKQRREPKTHRRRWTVYEKRLLLKLRFDRFEPPFIHPVLTWAEIGKIMRCHPWVTRKIIERMITYGPIDRRTIRHRRHPQLTEELELELTQRSLLSDWATLSIESRCALIK